MTKLDLSTPTEIETLESDVPYVIAQLQIYISQWAEGKGWWDEELAGNKRNDGEMIALMHSELSEALEGLRKPADSTISQGNLAEEMADTVIRILDFCAHRDIDLGSAIMEKMAVNEKRPYKHGGKAF
jgi:NTP pyrophosphatase (non-canonical NTP hydrolase)